ncbi:MAG TPA: hemolysin family protein [Longimicrobiales bacterium]|nr:hemolysin family protein [Longimicrobiales bacterium]
MISWIIALVLAIGVSAFLTAAEVALFALGDARVRSLVDNGESALARIRSRPRSLLVLLRFADGAAALVTGAAAYHIGVLLAGFWGGIAGLAVAAFVFVVVGEIWPRQILGERGVRFAIAVAPLMLGLSRILRPFLWPLEQLTRSLPEPRLTAVSEITDTEIRQLTALGRSEGSIDEHEGQIIERAFRLDETRVWDIMTPRVDMVAWPDSLTLDQIAPQFGSVPYSRIPVYDGSIDDVTGVLYLRDAYQALIAGQRTAQLRGLARQPLVVPGSLPLTRLLRDFQNRRIHLALVVDEYGGIDGLVTLEDVIEELVGEIEDEMDVTEVSIVRVSRSEIIAEGDTEIREINHIFNTTLPLLEHRSLNGYVMEQLGRVPQPHETLERQGLLIEVLDASETQVLRARITRLAPVAEGAGMTGEADVYAAAEDAAVITEENDGDEDGGGRSRTGAAGEQD